MNIKTKYKPGEKVWFMLSEPTCGEIEKLSAELRKGENYATVIYVVVPIGGLLGIVLTEKSLFETKEECEEFYR